MTARKHKPADNPSTGPDEHTPDDGLYSDASLREAIARLMLEEAETTPLSEEERRNRIESLRRKIASGEYMSDGRIEDVVDRLLRKWKL